MKFSLLIITIFLPFILKAQTRFMYDASGNMIIAKTKGVAGNCTTSGGRLEAVRLAADDSTRLILERPTAPSLQVAPNPTAGLLLIDYFIDKEQRAGLQLSDGAGQIVSVLAVQSHRQGYYRISYDMQPLAAQTYYLALLLPGRKPVTVKVVKL
jgi:hypothetical protein